MVDIELKEVANSWWSQQAEEFPGGKIPEDRAAALVAEFGQLMGVDQQTAMQYAKDSGMVGTVATKQTTQQQQPPVQKPDTNTGETMKAKRSSELVGQAKLVWDNLESTGNDTDKLLVILRKNGYPDATRQTVTLVRNTLRKKRYEVPFAPRGKDTHRSPRNTGSGRPATTTQPAPEMRAAANPSTAPSRATSINKKIEEIKAQIARLQEDLAALERAKTILES